MNYLQYFTGKNIQFQENVSMAYYSTFKAGGKAKVLVFAKNKDELKIILEKAKDEKIFILGNGSNILCSDSGFDGVVIKLSEDFAKAQISEDEIYVGSGMILSRLAVLASDNSLTGLEFAHGIPGSVGGAVYMNAGAYGGEIKEVLDYVDVMDRAGRVFRVYNKDCNFAYRHSVFTDSDNIILGANFKLSGGEQSEIRATMKDFSQRRKDKQPVEYPSAGSTFKRPQGHFAGALIESSGLKGKSVGDAKVSCKHAGFIINTGSATASDIIKLIDIVKEEVYKKHNIMLECEVNIL